MIPFRLDYAIEKILTGSNESSSQNILTSIREHKWYVSECLGRDVGLFVAAFDYFLNIQRLPSMPKTAN
jgi:hypothetical protein